MKKIVVYVVGLLFVCATTAIVIGSIFSQPVILSFVDSGSMQPAISPGDGFVAVPTQFTKPAEKGDIITFQAEELNGGGLVTHRIISEKDDGYITQGDANSFTDQSSAEPPVKNAQIVAEALQINGEVVVIPYLGAVVTGTHTLLSAVQGRVAALVGDRSLLGTQGLAYLFFTITLLYYVLSALRERVGGRERPTPTRNRTRETETSMRLVMAALAVLLVVSTTAAMVIPAGTQQYGVVSAEFESDRPDVIPTGESKTLAYTVSNGGSVPIRVFLEPASGGIDIEPREVYVDNNDHINATVTLSVPPQTGYYRRFLVEQRYLAVLPGPTIRALYELHPWAPIVVIDTLVGGGFYLFAIILVGTGKIRNRERSDKQSLTARLRRWFT